VGLTFAPASYGDISAKLSQGALVCAICGVASEGRALSRLQRSVSVQGDAELLGSATCGGDARPPCCIVAHCRLIACSPPVRLQLYNVQCYSASQQGHERMSLLLLAGWTHAMR
jgi:hypothetical protein